jgi:2-keto-4-pentenoate hydratase
MFKNSTEAAKWLFDAHDRRQTFMPIPGRQSDDSLTQAYNIQDGLVSLLQRRGGQPAGYKIGLTTPRMQQMCGIDHPIAGVVLAQRIHNSPVMLPLAEFVRLGIECELAVRLSRPISDNATIDEVKDCVQDVATAFELVEDRLADYRALDLHSLVADNSWNEGIVLGRPTSLKDVGDLEGVLTINGKVVDRGSSRDVLGHPLEAVAWLARHLAQRGNELMPGEWVMTGSIVPTKFANRGDHFVFSIDGLEPVSLTVT